MSRSTEFRLRWKGAITGPFPLARITDMLRAGEISLLHNIEVDGSWMTVRDFTRSTGMLRTPMSHSAEAPASGSDSRPLSGTSPVLGETASTETGRNAAGESLERSVREGYLWCGSTFLLPPLFALLVYGWQKVAPDTQPISLFILLTFTTAVGCFLPIVYVRKVGVTLDQEGLSEIRQTQAKLALLLSCLGFVLWLWCFWILVHARP